MITALRRYVIRSRFKAMVKVFDDKIEAARSAHQPVNHLIDAKRAFVREKLEGAALVSRSRREDARSPRLAGL